MSLENSQEVSLYLSISVTVVGRVAHTILFVNIIGTVVDSSERHTFWIWTSFMYIFDDAASEIILKTRNWDASTTFIYNSLKQIKIIAQFTAVVTFTFSCFRIYYTITSLRYQWNLNFCELLIYFTESSISRNDYDINLISFCSTNITQIWNMQARSIIVPDKSVSNWMNEWIK